MGLLVRFASGAVIGLALVLSLPGVQAVQAEEAPLAAGATREGPMCKAQAPLGSPAVVHETLERMAAAQSTPGQPKLQVLNNRGYRYEPSRTDVDFSALAREIALKTRQNP